MRLLLTIAAIAILSGIAELFLPWWSLALVAFLLAFAAGLRPGRAFLAGFTGILSLWVAVSLWKDIPNQHILSTRMAMVFGLNSYRLFLAVASAIGGVVGGMAGWSGGVVRASLPAFAK